jgi:hypothetical protein
MNAFELRLGNYVTIDNPEGWPQVKNVPVQVFEVKEKKDALELFPDSCGAVSMIYGDTRFSQFDEFVKPIPLTEDWLKRFGFEDDSYGRFYKKFNGNETITISFEDYAHTRLAEHPVEVKDFSLNINCKFVHSLQNLYYALTGEDFKVI